MNRIIMIPRMNANDAPTLNKEGVKTSVIATMFAKSKHN